MDEEQNINPDETQDRTSRILFGGVVAIGLATFIFGIFHLRNGIAEPFRLAAVTNANTNLGSTGQLLATLRNKDTDGDGLSDYDELYVYGTSPYLADSDSDGIPDGTEITNGTDPNCPTGQACTPIAASANATEQTNSSNTDISGTAATNSLLGLTNTGDVNVNSDAMTVAELRTTLKNSGAPAATIDSLDDATLLSMYQQVVAEAGGPVPANTNGSTVNAGTINGNTTLTNSSVPQTTNTALGATNSSATATNTSASGSIDPNTLQNLTPDQIRQFLKQGGADDAALSQVDDATLLSIFQQALQGMTNTSQ